MYAFDSHFLKFLFYFSRSILFMIFQDKLFLLFCFSNTKYFIRKAYIFIETRTFSRNLNFLSQTDINFLDDSRMSYAQKRHLSNRSRCFWTSSFIWSFIKKVYYGAPGKNIKIMNVWWFYKPSNHEAHLLENI